MGLSTGLDGEGSLSTMKSQALKKKKAHGKGADLPPLERAKHMVSTPGTAIGGVVVVELQSIIATFPSTTKLEDGNLSVYPA